MRYINLSKGLNLVMITLILLFFTTHIYAEQVESKKSYKTDKESIFMFPQSLEIDSKGNIYIGVLGSINIYDSRGEFQYAIKVRTKGDYQMKLDTNDNLNVPIVREDLVLVYNHDGYIIQEKMDKDSNLYFEYEKNNNKKLDAHGNLYKLSNFLGYTKVTKISPDGVETTIYKIPFIKWILKVFLLIVAILFMVTVTRIALKSRKIIK